MAIPYVLHLETATNICSVALSKGEEMLAIRESDEERSHGSLLTAFMEEVMIEAGVKPDDINAISVSKGPGSYTGLRIGVSATKGFAFALNIPVIGISTLQALSMAAMDNEAVKKLMTEHPELLFCPMIDARRMEVYSAMYDIKAREKSPVKAVIVEQNSFLEALESGNIVFFGNGSDKVAEIIKHPKAHFVSGINPSSRYMIPLSMQAYHDKSFENTAYFEPFYLKDFVATTPKNKIL